MQRYFVNKENEEFILQDSDFHHIKDVMHIKNNGQIICIYDNKSYLCSITYNKNSYQIKVLNDISKDAECSKQIILYQALIRNEKFDLVVQKATELGVSEIVPTSCQRSVIKIENNKENDKLNRYNKIIKEASEQSHRQVLAKCNRYTTIKDIKLDKDTLGILAYENETDKLSLKDSLNNLNSYQKIALVIGPEGGFTIDEITYLLNIGFKSVSLGKTILRSETAAIYLLSVVNYVLGDETL